MAEGVRVNKTDYGARFRAFGKSSEGSHAASSDMRICSLDARRIALRSPLLLASNTCPSRGRTRAKEKPRRGDSGALKIPWQGMSRGGAQAPTKVPTQSGADSFVPAPSVIF
jgi:hypothetical protein